MNFNKNFAYLLIATGSIISCSKSTDPAPSLVGTWNVSTFRLAGCTDGSQDFPDTPCETMGLSVLVSCGTWVFTTTTISITGSTLPGPTEMSYTLTGNTITYTISGIILSIGTYEVTPTTLTITSGYESVGAGCKLVERYTRQ